MNDIETNTRENFPYPKSDSETRSSEERWHLLGTRVPKAEIVYFSQMLIVYVIIITSITNLSLQNGSTELWISLLSSCIGYALPNPKLKKWSAPCLLNPAPAFASVDRREAENRDGFTDSWNAEPAQKTWKDRAEKKGPTVKNPPGNKWEAPHPCI